ncbi:hypothetical protein PHJA_001177200 [Phtheirospermum japonicum]|uniref:Uncharacterized protein n=1 Tax=Phtheirospermum japonicum TaxID=374723 RepID=A0A830C2E6_9LAMI|nr:hypothetical protein PHJA_001177200 [Phtheirospermum japonicum]
MYLSFDALISTPKGKRKSISEREFVERKTRGEILRLYFTPEDSAAQVLLLLQIRNPAVIQVGEPRQREARSGAEERERNREEKLPERMIYRNWSLLTGPTTILAGIIGTFVNSDLLFVENDDSLVAMMVELPDVGEWKKVLRRPLKFYGLGAGEFSVVNYRESLSRILGIGKAVIQTRFDVSGDQLRSHDCAKKSCTVVRVNDEPQFLHE